MRDLTVNEIAYVSGAEDHTVTVIDPIVAIQTFALLYSVTDQQNFQRAFTILGMGVGGIGGGSLAYTAAVGATYGTLACVGATAGGVVAGAFVGGAALRIGSMGAVAMYNMLIG